MTDVIDIQIGDPAVMPITPGDLAAEASARASGDAAETAARETAISAEASARVSGDAAEASAREDADDALGALIMPAATVNEARAGASNGVIMTPVDAKALAVDTSRTPAPTAVAVASIPGASTDAAGYLDGVLDPDTNIGSSSRFGWVVGVAFSGYADPATFSLEISNTANVKKLKVLGYSRLVSSTYTDGPSVADGDKLLFSQTVDVSGAEQVDATHYTRVDVPLPAVGATAAEYLLFHVTGFQSDGTTAVALGIQARATAGVTPQALKGYYQTTSGGSWNAYSGRLAARLWGRASSDVVAGARRPALRVSSTKAVDGLYEIAGGHTRPPIKSAFGSTFQSWLITDTLAEDAFVDIAEMQLSFSAAPTTLRIALYVQSGGGTATGDALRNAARVYSADLVAAGRVSGTAAQLVRLPLDGKFRKAGVRIGMTVQALDADGALLGIGAAAGVVGASEETWLAGAYQLSGDLANAWRSPSAGSRIWGRFLTRKALLDLPRVSAIEGQASDRLIPVSRQARDGAGWAASLGSWYWGWAIRPDKSIRKIAGVGVWLRDVSGLTTITFEAWRRDYNRALTLGDKNPGADSLDVLLSRKAFAIADLVADPSDNREQLATFRHAEAFGADADSLLMFAISGRDATLANKAFGIAGAPVSSPPAWGNAWFNTGTGVPSTVSSDRSLGYLLFEAAPQPAKTPPAALVIGARVEIVEEPVYVQAGTYTSGTAGLRAFVLPRCALLRASEPLAIPPVSVNLAQLSNGTVTDSLANLSGPRILSAATILASPAPVVTRVSDSVVLTSGTDYTMDYVKGTLDPVGSGLAYAITVAYTAQKMRYDLVSVDPDTGAYTVTAGTARFGDPNENAAVLPSGQIEVGRILVTNTSATFIPTCRFVRYVPRGGESEFEAWRSWCRQWLKGTLRKLRTGAAINMVGYGDSNGNAGQGSGGTELGANQAFQDRREFYGLRLPSDALAIWAPAFDGTAGVGLHTHSSWNWNFKAELEAGWGSTITFYNRHIGGSSSDSVNHGGGVYGGTNTDRLAALIANDGHAPDLVLVAFGMNELGATDTKANLVSLISQLHTAGIEAILLTPPQVNSVGLTATQEMWEYTSRQIVEAAIEARCAYVPFGMIFGQGREGAIGLSRQTATLENSYNHAMPYEHQQYGRLIARLFD